MFDVEATIAVVGDGCGGSIVVAVVVVVVSMYVTESMRCTSILEIINNQIGQDRVEWTHHIGIFPHGIGQQKHFLAGLFYSL